eukprot:994581-Rhodomonas_salina.1
MPSTDIAYGSLSAYPVLTKRTVLCRRQRGASNGRWRRRFSVGSRYGEGRRRYVPRAVLCGVRY